MQYRSVSRNIHPVGTCHYCGRTDIESSGRSLRIAPGDDHAVWFCRDTCSVMEKHELGICTMEMWLYKDILQKSYPRMYELKFGQKVKNQQGNRVVQGRKKNRSDTSFKYTQKKSQKVEGSAENKFGTLQ